MTARRVGAHSGLIASMTGASAALAAPPPDSFGAHVSGCAHIPLGRPDPPQVTCVHEGHVHTFATFGQLVAHLREHPLDQTLLPTGAP